MVKKIIKSLLGRRKVPSFKRLGKQTTIGEGLFTQSEYIEIGNECHVGYGAHWAGLGGIVVEDNVIIGPNSTIISFNHNYFSDEYIPYDGKELLKKVVIKSNAWLGINVSINPGITIGEGAIVAMGAVVTKDVEPCTIVGGNPAKVIGKRDETLYQKLKSEGKTYIKYKREGKIKKESIRVS